MYSSDWEIIEVEGTHMLRRCVHEQIKEEFQKGTSWILSSVSSFLDATILSHEFYVTVNALKT